MRKKHRVVLDSCQYDLKENGCLTLKGWIYSGEEQAKIQVRLGREPLDCEIRRVKRPDVIKALPRHHFPDEYAGFEIHISDLKDLLARGETLRIRILTTEKTFPLLQRTMPQLQRDYERSTLRYCVDILEKRIDQIYIQGWCISTEGDPFIRLLNEQGQEIRESVFTEVRRSDLSDLFGLREDQCHGFILTVPRKDIRDREITLRFENPVTSRSEKIRMSSFDWDNSRPGRTLKVFGKNKNEKNLEVLKEAGPKGFLQYVYEEACAPEELYGYYLKRTSPSARELKRQSAEAFSPAPLFSIVVPLYHTPENYLKEMIDSVIAQSYGNWELCLADGSGDDSLQEIIRTSYGKDRRIRYRKLDKNEGISGNTNKAIEMAGGDYIVFADHDDTLTPDALYENMQIIRTHPDTALIYSDEDLTNAEGVPFDPHFKPDFNLDYLRAINYICHLVVVKRSLLEKTGLLDPEMDGSQDFDLLLRCAEKTNAVYHIPKILYHWRSHAGSTAGHGENKQYAVDAGIRALDAHYRRLDLPVRVSYTGIPIVYHTSFEVKGCPKVSILIPNKDHTEDLEKCIRSILEKTTWENLEILVIENNSEKPETFGFYKELEALDERIRVLYYKGGFNYSAINNCGEQYAEGDYLLLLNNDTEVITPDWITQMLGYCQREDVGAVGAKLFYPDDTIQHAGVVLGIGGVAGHIETGKSREDTGCMRRLAAAQDISAVTGACMMVKRSVFRSLKGLDERLAVAFNDVDLCLRIRETGLLVVFLPDVQLYHYESKSRGYETTPEKIRRFEQEIGIFKTRHAFALKKGDPYYNPNLTLERNDCSLKRAFEDVKGKKK